jgi:hypothetical protein
MDSILTLFLLFIAALTAMLTYLVLPYVPVMMLTMVAVGALALGLWWHWTQFSIDYRLSTWQENLRNYASYAILFVVILLSYGFYVFVWKAGNGSVAAAVQQATASARNAGRRASSQIIGGTTRALTGVSNTLLSEAPRENTGGPLL